MNKNYEPSSPSTKTRLGKAKRSSAYMHLCRYQAINLHAIAVWISQLPAHTFTMASNQQTIRSSLNAAWPPKHAAPNHSLFSSFSQRDGRLTRATILNLCINSSPVIQRSKFDMPRFWVFGVSTTCCDKRVRVLCEF